MFIDLWKGFLLFLFEGCRFKGFIEFSSIPVGQNRTGTFFVDGQKTFCSLGCFLVTLAKS